MGPVSLALKGDSCNLDRGGRLRDRSLIDLTDQFGFGDRYRFENLDVDVCF